VRLNRAAERLLQPGDAEPYATNRARIARFVSDLVEHACPSTRSRLVFTGRPTAATAANPNRA